MAVFLVVTVAVAAAPRSAVSVAAVVAAAAAAVAVEATAVKVVDTVDFEKKVVVEGLEGAADGVAAVDVEGIANESGIAEGLAAADRERALRMDARGNLNGGAEGRASRKAPQDVACEVRAVCCGARPRGLPRHA